MPNRASVLIIDDDAAFAEALSRALTESGYVVTEASNVTQAHARLKHGRFDVAVVDLNLAGENGVELIRQIHMMKRQMQIVGMSAVESDLYLEIAGWVGANTCVRKYPALPDGRFPAEKWTRT